MNCGFAGFVAVRYAACAAPGSLSAGMSSQRFLAIFRSSQLFSASFQLISAFLSSAQLKKCASQLFLTHPISSQLSSSLIRTTLTQPFHCDWQAAGCRWSRAVWWLTPSQSKTRPAVQTIFMINHDDLNIYIYVYIYIILLINFVYIYITDYIVLYDTIWNSEAGAQADFHRNFG